MRSAPSLCSAATAHCAPASTLFSSSNPTLDSNSALSSYTALFPQASVHFVLPLPFTLLSSSNSTLDANLALSSNATFFPQACSLFYGKLASPVLDHTLDIIIDLALVG